MSNMKSLAIALCVVFVSAERGQPSLVNFFVERSTDLASSDRDSPSERGDQLDSLERIIPRQSNDPDAPGLKRPDDLPRRRVWGWINNNIIQPVANTAVTVYETTVDVGEMAVDGAVDVGSSIVEFVIDLIGPDGFSEKLAREWLNKRIGGVKVRDVLKSGHSKMKSYKSAGCTAMKAGVLPLLRGRIVGQNDGVLYAGHSKSGGFVYGQSVSQGVFVDHNGFEGCYETTCEYHGFHAGGGIGVEAGFLHGEGTNDMPGDATAGGASFDLGPGLDVTGGFTSGGKGFVELGTGKGVGVNLGSWFECNTKIYATNENTCKVTLYEHDNFQGSRKYYGTGSVPMVWKNDEVSSMKVHGHGCVATVYQHGDYKGWSAKFGQGSYTLSQLKAKGFKNDDMSSLKVKKSRRRSEELMAGRLASFMNKVED